MVGQGDPPLSREFIRNAMLVGVLMVVAQLPESMHALAMLLALSEKLGESMRMLVMLSRPGK
jgi:hypothetical protein